MPFYNITPKNPKFEATSHYNFMTSAEIHVKVQELVKVFNKETFIYDLLLAYGISKTSITRLQKGDFNLAKNEDEILYKKKLFFKEVNSDNLMALVDDYGKDDNLKHNPHFIIITNYKEIASKDTRTNKNLHVSTKDLPKNHTFFFRLRRTGCTGRFDLHQQ